MENKKKCHGGLKVLLLPLFIMLLGMFSTCYARTTIEQNEAEYIWNYLVTFAFSGDIDNGEYLNLYRYPASNSTVYSRKNINYSQQFMEYFNNNNTIDFRNDLQDLIIVAYCERSGSSIIIHLNIGSFNNGKFEGKPHLAFRFPANINTDTLTINTVDDNKNNINSTTQYLRINLFDNDTVTFSNLNLSTHNYIGSGLQTRFTSWNNPPKYETVLNCIPGIVSFSSTNSIYTNWDGTTFYSELQPKLLQSLFDRSVEPEPEQPSGDTPITPSGENSGNIDYTNQLTNINNSINNIQGQISGDSQKVIENQNQNTQTIVNAISGEVGKINNTLTDDADDTIDNTKITSGDISNTVDFSTIDNNQNYNAYTNFWYNLTTGFSNSMIDVVRTLPIEFRNQNYLVNLDDFTVFIPNVLKVFLGIISSVFVCLYITRESKHIVEDIQTASIDNVANKLTEDFETNMF